MSTFSKGQQEQYRMFVIEELINAYKFDKETAINLAHNSVFSKMLAKHPDFVGHYNVEYWASRIKSEYDNRLPQTITSKRRA